jgi:hypothetical protein
VTVTSKVTVTFFYFFFLVRWMKDLLMGWVSMGWVADLLSEA